MWRASGARNHTPSTHGVAVGYPVVAPTALDFSLRQAGNRANAEAVLQAGRLSPLPAAPAAYQNLRNVRSFRNLTADPETRFISSNLATLGPHLAPRK